MPPLTWRRNLHARLQAQRAGPGLDAEDTGQLDRVSASKELPVQARACIPPGAAAPCHLVSVHSRPRQLDCWEMPVLCSFTPSAIQPLPRTCRPPAQVCSPT